MGAESKHLTYHGNASRDAATKVDGYLPSSQEDQTALPVSKVRRNSLLSQIFSSSMASQLVKKTACVIGGTGFVASLLVKLLLEKGYAVNTTVRDPENHKKVAHLTALQNLGDLKIFGADLTNEESFDAPIAGCDLVFHVATPVNFASEDPENDMIKPAIQGVHNVLRACAKAKTVKRVILTSSAAAVSINKLNGTGLIMDEKNWTDVEFLTSEKPPTWGYPASKTLAEKAAWKFAEENNIDLITVIPSLMTGPSLTQDVPSSVKPVNVIDYR
ncbi:hypothetical protein OIU78_000209 [Salix suchowensis]|nr:hypothetical protein OIU78_000209 [Salix suchowensis]